MTENPPSTHKRNGLGTGRPDHHRLHHRSIDGLLCDPFDEKVSAESPTLILLVHKELGRRQRPRSIGVSTYSLRTWPSVPTYRVDVTLSGCCSSVFRILSVTAKG